LLGQSLNADNEVEIPSLRNVALTAPSFHNGDARTLREVVELYSRGGNVAPLAERDGTPIEPLGVPRLTDDEIDAVVAFLESLTDERVLYRRAPFDHQQLFVPGFLEGPFGPDVNASSGRPGGVEGWHAVARQLRFTTAPATGK
jgi:hypothetical protein